MAMDDIDSKIADLESELQRLSTVIDALGERLAAGDKSVRAELNPAIRRAGELRSELSTLMMASGRLEVGPAPMYGPPRFW
jgi:hypothetical protein